MNKIKLLTILLLTGAVFTAFSATSAGGSSRNSNKTTTSNYSSTSKYYSKNYSLSIKTDVKNAKVIIYKNNNDIYKTGYTPTTFTIKEGSYRVLIQKSGYDDYKTTVDLSRNRAISIKLNKSTSNLNLSTNTGGAVFIIRNKYNGKVFYKGHEPVRMPLFRGLYTIEIVKKGFKTIIRDLDFDNDFSYRYQLEYETGTIKVVLSDEIKNYSQFKNPGTQILLYIDGVKMNKRSNDVKAGRHTVTLVSGGFKFEKIVTVKSGKKLILEPKLSF